MTDNENLVDVVHDLMKLMKDYQDTSKNLLEAITILGRTSDSLIERINNLEDRIIELEGIR